MLIKFKKHFVEEAAVLTIIKSRMLEINLIWNVTEIRFVFKAICIFCQRGLVG